MGPRTNPNSSRSHSAALAMLPSSRLKFSKLNSFLRITTRKMFSNTTIFRSDDIVFHLLSCQSFVISAYIYILVNRGKEILFLYNKEMIGSIKGKIILKTDKFLIVEAGGVGYKVSVSPDALSKTGKTGDDVSFWIHTHVREDILDLYGFLNREELEFFEMLINVSGIGPKGALAILG